jgi:hypothetical protein
VKNLRIEAEGFQQGSVHVADSVIREAAAARRLTSGHCLRRLTTGDGDPAHGIS